MKYKDITYLKSNRSRCKDVKLQPRASALVCMDSWTNSSKPHIIFVKGMPNFLQLHCFSPTIWVAWAAADDFQDRLMQWLRVCQFWRKHPSYHAQSHDSCLYSSSTVELASTQVILCLTGCWGKLLKLYIGS